MAQNNIWLPDWYSRTNMDPTLEIQAALLAQYGTIGDNIPSGLSGNNVFYNSTTQTSAHDITTTVLNGDTSGIVSSKYPYHDLDLAGSALGCTGVGFSVDYFITRSYGFDDRLKTSPPPYWPSGDSKWVLVSSWLEN
jgi:hypothetical protein